MFGKWCEENKKTCYALIILVVLVLLWYVGILKVTVTASSGAPVETVVAHRDFESALASKYEAVTKDAGGMTADDKMLEKAFMSGQTM